MMTTVPDDVLYRVLVLLPVMSLLRFKSVCKSWLELIESSNFISQQYLHQKEDNFFVMYIGKFDLTAGHKFWFRLFPGRHKFDLSFDLYLPPEIPSSFAEFYFYSANLVGSCKGIICIDVEKVDVALWNPATKQSRLLPESLLPKPQLHDEHPDPTHDRNQINLGFGLDRKTNEFKVIRFIFENGQGIELVNTLVELYSLSTNSWKILVVGDGSRFSHNHVYSDPKVPCPNGVYCWLANTNGTADLSILSFDFSDEVFGTIPLPDIDICSSYDISLGMRINTMCLGFVQEKLACVIDFDKGLVHRHFETWVMNEFGVKESWSKLYRVDDTPRLTHYPIGLLQNGEFLLMYKDQTLHLYNQVTHEIKDLHIRNILRSTEFSGYKESLVSIRE